MNEREDRKMTITTNEMIFRTLKTKGDKPAKYADQLREMGYEVTNVSRNGDWTSEYWTVNDLELKNLDCSPIYLSLRNSHVEKLANIKNIDFVNYFATLEGRTEKAKAMMTHDDIEQRRYYNVYKYNAYIDEDGNEHRYQSWGWRSEVRRRRRHDFEDINHVVTKYNLLKDKAEARGYWNREDDGEINFAKRLVADAEQNVLKLQRELELAKEEVERRKANVQKEIDRKAAGANELNDWLVAKGIR